MTALHLKITARLLLNFRKRSSSWIFSLICVLGISLTVLVFFLVQAIVAGYQSHIREALLSFQAPLQVVLPVAVSDDHAQKLLKEFATKRADEPVVWTRHEEFYGLLDLPGLTSPVGAKVRTLSDAHFKTILKSSQLHWAPDVDQNAFLASETAILMGEKVFEKFPPSVLEDEFLDVIHPFADLGPTGDFEPQVEPFEFVGIVATGTYDIDETYVFVSEKGRERFLNTVPAQRVYQVFGGSSAHLQDLKSFWKSHVKQGAGFESWEDRNAQLVQLMKIEKAVIALLFAFLIAIATVNLSSLVHIFGAQNLHSFAIMGALGLSQSGIHKVFWQMGLLLGLAGTALGLGLGSVAVLVLMKFPLELPATYGFTQLPILFPVKTFGWLLVGIPVFCLMISFVAARRWASLPVAEVLRKV